MRGHYAFLLVAALLPWPVSGQVLFQSTNRLVFGTPADLTASIVFTDVDSDGDLDAVLANGGTGRR